MRTYSATTGCVLLFSGGRDSTVAALRLAPEYQDLTLLTVSTEHLVGLESVAERLEELQTVLPRPVRWIHAVARPTSLVTIGAETIDSCLPCHHVYLKTAVSVARRLNAGQIAVGYAGYQDTWLEQTPYAITGLQMALAEVDIRLLLPSANLSSKEESIRILQANGLRARALEQKCLKQQFNSKDLSAIEIQSEIDAWVRALQKSFRAQALTDVEIRTEILLEKPENTRAE